MRLLTEPEGFRRQNYKHLAPLERGGLAERVKLEPSEVVLRRSKIGAQRGLAPEEQNWSAASSCSGGAKLERRGLAPEEQNVYSPAIKRLRAP